jgi:hypothetical protein
MHIGALIGKAVGDAVADPAGATDHQHRLVLKIQPTHRVSPYCCCWKWLEEPFGL